MATTKANGTPATAKETAEQAIEKTAANLKNATDKATENIETAEEKATTFVDQASARATHTVEAVEVKVNEVIGNASQSTTWVVDTMRRMLLASVGAVAMTLDEAETLVGKMVERGELAQKDGQKLLKQLRSRVNPRGGKAEQLASERAEKVSERFEAGMEDVLSRLNIPSKRDIEELSARIAQLSARIEELKKSK